MRALILLFALLLLSLPMSAHAQQKKSDKPSAPTGEGLFPPRGAKVHEFKY